jgi:hypothetical protein
MASYAELRKKYAEGPSVDEKFRQQYAGPIKSQPASEPEKKPVSEKTDNAITEAISKFLPKATTAAAPKRDAAAYEQAKQAAKEEKAKKGYTEEQDASFIAPSQQLYDAAEKEYEDYINSEAHKNLKLQNMAIEAVNTMPANSASSYAARMQNQNLQQVQEDTKEKELRAKRDYYKNMVNAENDRYVMESDLAELATWTEEDRSDLDKYVGFRQAGITSGGYAVPAKEAYNNLVAKYGKEKVDQLAYTWQRDKNAKDAKSLAERSAAAVKGNTGAAVGHSVATVPANLLGSVTGAYGVAMDWATRDNRYSTLDPNNIGTMASVYSGAVRGQVAEDIAGNEYDEEGNLVKEGGAVRKAASIGYQGLMSAADSVTRAVATGGFSPVLAATGTFSQTASEASKQGATPEQAMILGIGKAAVEYATEKIPLDNMLKAAKGGIKGAQAIAVEALRQGGIEATTEEISLFANMLVEAAVLKEKSAYKQQIGEAIANGMTYDEAKAQADKAVMAEALNTAAVSGFAGILYGGGSAFVGRNAQTPVTAEVEAQNGTEAAVAPDTQTQAEQPTQSQPQQDVAQAVAQELTQAQQAEADAKAAQEQTQEAVAQGMAEQYGPMMPQAEPKSQLQQDIDNATAATLAENGIGQAPQTEAEAEVEAPVAEIAENQDIKGTGAAEQNFSGKAQYQDLLYEGNVQPDREGDVRPMEVPKTDPYGRNVSEFVANAYGAEVTPDEMAGTIEELVQEGALGFDRRSNQSALNDAAKEIEKRSPSAVTKRITSNIARGKLQDGDIEQAMLLYSHYANKNGERAQAQAAELMVDLTTMAHMTGRNLQLFKLLRKLTPEGQVMTVKRTVEQNVESMIRSGKAAKDSKVEINEQLLEEYKKAAAENARAVSAEQKAESEAKMQELQQAIMTDAASQIKSTFKAKWDAWRYMAMLGNGKTQIRNFAGNALFMPYKAAKDTIGAAFEKAIPKEKRTKALTTDFELLNWAKQDSKTGAVHDALKYTGKLGDDATNAKFADQVKVFDNKALEATRKAVEGLPQNADLAFKNAYYAQSLAGFLRARGYKLSDIQSGNVSDAIMTEARGYAINEAMKATFNDCNAFSDAVSNIGRSNTDNAWSKAFNYAAESVLPFRRTPANVVVRFAEYSPAGMLKGAWDMADKVATGKLSAASAIDQVASGVTGTGALMLGYLLAKGIGGVKLTGSGADEDEKRQGHQDYALEFSINGKEYSYKIDWAAPANLPLFVGANLYSAMESNGEDTDISTLSKIWQVSKGAFEPMLQLSCMSSLNDLFETARYAPEGEALYSVAADIATGYFTQGIPALVRQAAQAKQVNKQTTFANDADPTVRELQKLGAQIPFAGEQFQTEKRNAWGETETTEDPVMRAFNAFINPGTLKQIDNSELEKEISRLNKAQEHDVTPPDIPKKLNYTDTQGNVHDGYRLTEDQYQTIAVTQGQTAKKVLGAMTKSMEYKNLTDVQKAYAINAAYEYAQEKGKQAALPDYYSKASAWIAETRESDTAAFVARGAEKAMNDAIGNAVERYANNWTVSDAAKADMDATYKAFSKMYPQTQAKILDELSSDALRYIEGRKGGATTQNYLDATGKVKKLGTDAKDREKYAAIAKMPNVSESAKDALIKTYMPNYNPDSSSPNLTELKYDYIRQDMEKAPNQYADIMEVYNDVKNIDSEELEAKNQKRKDVYIAEWVKIGMSEENATELYNLLVTNGKQKIDVVGWHNGK